MDPLDAVWLRAAGALGLRVERTAGAYATTDGAGTLSLSTAEDFDADDCLAQMIFHEVCHWLVQGEDAVRARDWGLDNESDVDLVREHATLRTQAFLADRHGLRAFLAPTTEHRAFYDALPARVLAPGRAPSVLLARRAITLAGKAPFAPHLDDALAATRTIVRAVAAPPREDGAALPTLYDAPAPASGGETCSGCAWLRRGACVQHGTRRRATDSACERFEPPLDCTDCGACCREAYHAVNVSRRDPFVRIHPELLVRRGRSFDVVRAQDRCGALEGGREANEPYRCRVYEDRPRTCRDFTLGSAHCLTARRRVALSL